MFDADRPITKSEQDRLGRTVFAKYLARSILDHTSSDCLTLGLYGGWGTGKTSIINLTLEELRFAASNMFDQEKPIILNFSPWSYSGQDQLIYSFFRRLTSEMRMASYFENADNVIHLLELYISFFTHKPVPKYLRPKHSIWTRLTKPKITAEETIGWESGRDLTQVKAELNQILARQKHKIIIFVDNIARMEDKEINEIFQIVKSIGDMSNFIYILALDKGRVIQVLNKLHGGGGFEFLEKIVQLPFNIPQISKQDIEMILLDRLQKILEMVPQDAWQKEYWADLYYSSLKYFFDNVRDITRFVNTLSFSYEHVKNIVNPADFFAITAIEIFEPEVYYGIRDNKDLFADLAEDVYQLDKQKLNEDKVRIDEILSRAVNTPIEMLQQLLVRLFPRLRSIYQADISFFHSEIIARKNRRICSFDMFDIYFRLSIPSGTISDDEMDAILSLAHDETGFALALLRLNQDERIIKFLDLLDSRNVHRIATDDIQNVISALIDSGDLFPQGESSLLSFDTPMRIHRIIHQLLRRYEKSEDRFKIVHEAIKKSVNSIYIFIHEIKEQEREHIESEDTNIPVEQRDFSPLELSELKHDAVNKIIYWAKLNRLPEHPKILAILFAWAEWGNEDECKQYVEQMTRDDKGLLAFLMAVFKEPINEAISKGKSEANPLWAKNISDVEAFIEPKLLVPHAKAMFEDVSFEKLRDTEQLALLIFLNIAAPNVVKVFPTTV